MHLERFVDAQVDFFSGIVLRALGIPESMFTVLFAVARSVGWIVQWKEMASEAPNKISRPRQVLFTPSQTTTSSRVAVPLFPSDLQCDPVIVSLFITRRDHLRDRAIKCKEGQCLRGAPWAGGSDVHGRTGPKRSNCQQWSLWWQGASAHTHSLHTRSVLRAALNHHTSQPASMLGQRGGR